MSAYGGRHRAASLGQVRPDHVQRYLFASEYLAALVGPGVRILDAGCGCGYGSGLLAERGFDVTGTDIDADSIVFAHEHWTQGGARFRRADLAQDVGSFDAVVCFEALEHIEHAQAAVAAFRAQAPVLIASVPNEDVLPFNGHEYHMRHDRPGELEELLHGYRIRQRRTQHSKAPGKVEGGFDGRTLVVFAERKG